MAPSFNLGCRAWYRSIYYLLYTKRHAVDTSERDMYIGINKAKQTRLDNSRAGGICKNQNILHACHSLLHSQPHHPLLSLLTPLQPSSNLLSEPGLPCRTITRSLPAHGRWSSQSARFTVVEVISRFLKVLASGAGVHALVPLHRITSGPATRLYRLLGRYVGGDGRNGR